jgi:AraC-like DNA-binding protein
VKQALLQKLSNRHRSLKNPADYFKGTGPFSMELISNVLIFNRKDRKEFGRESRDIHHHRYVMIINLKSRGNVIVDQLSLPFSPGQALLIHPHQFHHFLNIETAHMSWLFITFELKDTRHLGPLRNKTVPVSSDCLIYIERLTHYYLKKAAYREIRKNRIILLTALILNELMESSRQLVRHRKKLEKKKTGLTLVGKINDYIYENLGRNIGMSDIARHFSYSQSHLRMLYRKTMEMSIGNYRQELRIKKAQELLSYSEMNISQIGDACGFDSVYSFSRAFRKRTGMAPSDYRNKFKGL